MAEGRIILVFECGGDRDKTKRLLMGRVAARMRDITILISDNPRSEEPAKIIKEIELGIKEVNPFCRYLINENRFEAIKEALSLARNGDIVLIAGKGHEDYKIVKDKRYPFSDKSAVRKILGAKDDEIQRGFEVFVWIRKIWDKIRFV